MAMDIEAMRATLNGETARIDWNELQPFFARGMVIKVSAALDLVEVAAHMAIDDKTAIAAWLEKEQVGKVSDEVAQEWHERNPSLWTVVVAPWVLVQEKAH